MMDREELDKKLWIIREATEKFNADAGDAIAEILAEFDRLEALLREETRCRMEGWGKVVELRKENERLNTGNAYLLLQLERICEPLKKFSTEELRRHNPYLPHDDAEHGTLWTIIERICDYLDSQGKPDILSTEATLRRMIEDKCAFCEKPKGICICCGKEINADNFGEHLNFACLLKDEEEVLRGILSRHSTGHAISGRGYWAIKCKGIDALFADILKHFKPKEGTTTKTVSTWTE